MKDKLYTGVGSRKTPVQILRLIVRIAKKLNILDYQLRSGGADGADKAFASGSSNSKIYRASDCTPEAMEIAAKFHPAWNRCSDFARRLHGRNAFQVLGRNLNQPSNFLICWTPDGAISHSQRSRTTGGTGTAISIADAYNVPVFNLSRREHLDRIKVFLK